MRRSRGPSLLVTVSLLFLGIFLHQSDALAVMSVDLGSEFMKVAIVRPGVPMEIAMNKESRRKTPVVVAMRNGERTIGDEALNTAVKYPKMAYWFMQSLVGKDMDHPQVKQFQERYPYYTLERDYITGMPIFVHDDGSKFTVEELFAMVLENAKQTAEAFAEQPISEAVITVPPFFNQAERRAMLRAAELAGIKVLQLMNDNAAVALNYGVFRSKSFNKTATHYMFFDVGSGSTTATVVAYQTADSKDVITGIKETNPQVTVKGVGFDRTLGGVEFQLRLRDHLAKLFDKQKKTKMDLYSNDRAMAKLFKEAGRLMKVLSANTHHMSQIEGLLDDEDFKAPVTRAEFEELCTDLFERVSKPVLDALKSSQVTWDEINEVILMGGGTRIPKIQDILQKTIGREELGKSINTDEAAALGAVYQAAHLSKGFKVKKFIVKDANLYPIQVEFERAKKDDNEVEESKKMVKRTLFGFLNPYPQKKVMTFNKHVSDFTFEVNYGEQDQLSEEQMKTFGNRKLQKITLEGVGDAFTKHSSSNAESKGVKAHFRMDESGILLFEKAESIFERALDAAAEEESTLSKLGSFFFGGSDDKDKDKDAKTEESTDENKDKEKKRKEKEGETDKKEETKDEEQKKEPDESKKTEEASDDKKSDSEKAEVEPETETDNVETDSENENGSEQDESANQVQDDSEEKEKTEEQDKKPEEGEEKEEEKKTEDEQKEKEEEGEKKDEQNDEKSEGEKKEDSKDEKKEEKKKEEEKKEKKPQTVKEQLKSEFKLVDISDPSEDQIKASKKIIKDLKKKDEEKLLLAKATNDLESFIIDTQDKLYQEDYEKCSTEEERTELQANLSAASDWLYEQDETVERKAYEDKLKELKKQTRKLFERVAEYQERPRAIEALNSIMNYSEHFLVGMQNYTGEDQPFTEVEYTTLEKLINETREWNKTATEEQAGVPLTEKPKMTVEDIAKKIGDLDREVKYLISKAKYFRPKSKPTDEKKSNKTKVANDTIDVNETKTEQEPTEEDEEKEERKPVADGATDEEGTEEGVQMDIPPMPGSEEEAEAKKKERQKKKEDKDGEEEETLQLDAADTDAPAEDTKKSDSDKSSKKTSHHGHDPDDEL